MTAVDDDDEYDMCALEGQACGQARVHVQTCACKPHGHVSASEPAHGDLPYRHVSMLLPVMDANGVSPDLQAMGHST